MEKDQSAVSGFEAPRPAKSRTVADLYAKYGLGETPSLEDIEPVAKSLWGNLATRLDATQLVLGRRVDSGEVSERAEDPMLGQVCGLPDAGQAFGLLLMVRDMEQNPNPGPGESF